jgi:hypothetical protein
MGDTEGFHYRKEAYSFMSVFPAVYLSSRVMFDPTDKLVKSDITMTDFLETIHGHIFI